MGEVDPADTEARVAPLRCYDGRTSEWLVLLDTTPEVRAQYPPIEGGDWAVHSAAQAFDIGRPPDIIARKMDAGPHPDQIEPPYGHHLSSTLNVLTFNVQSHKPARRRAAFREQLRQRKVHVAATQEARAKAEADMASDGYIAIESAAGPAGS